MKMVLLVMNLLLNLNEFREYGITEKILQSV